VYGVGCSIFGLRCEQLPQSYSIPSENYTYYSNISTIIHTPYSLYPLDVEGRGGTVHPWARSTVPSVGGNIHMADLLPPRIPPRVPPPIPPRVPTRPLIPDLQEVKDTESKDESKHCIICQTNERIIAFNCGHKHTCASCSIVLIKGRKPCPSCRSEITSATRIFD